MLSDWLMLKKNIYKATSVLKLFLGRHISLYCPLNSFSVNQKYKMAAISRQNCNIEPNGKQKNNFSKEPEI